MIARRKRIYEPPAPDDGTRVLIDRLWPRGLSKANAAVDVWLKEIAPSHELRRWYTHEPARWERFRARYFAELDAAPEPVAALRELLARGPVTLLFSSREADLNNARALAEYLENDAGPRP